MMEKKSDKNWPYRSLGIPDALFSRGKVPMTKEEVRTLALSKARIGIGDVVYDIGAGTGSITVEAALLAPEGKVFAIERNPDAVELIQENTAKFGVGNVEILCGEAPAALDGLPAPDRVIIGGSGGHMETILEEVMERLAPGGRVVVTAILLETAGEVTAFCRRNKWPMEMVQVSVARAEPAGGKNLLKGLNPVFIMTIEKTPM